MTSLRNVSCEAHARPSILLQGLAYCAVLTILCAICAPALPVSGEEHESAARTAQDSFERTPDGTGKVTGTVLENKRDCVRDGTCRLRIKAGSVEVLVRYNPGEAPCLNTAPARAGIEVEPGQRVSAFGRIVGSGDEHVIDTCPSTEFYIKLAD